MDRYGSLRQGLVGAWCPSLGVGGYTLADRSNLRRNGTLQGGATWSAGALSNIGFGSYVSVWPSSIVGALSRGVLSVTAWVRPASVSGTQTVAGTIASSGAYGTFNFEIGRSAGKVTLLQNGFTVDATSAATISAETWSFIGFSRAGTTGAWTIFLCINGAIESFSVSANPSTNTNGGLSIGRAGDLTSSLYFNGLIDDVRIWNRPLTASEFGLLRTGRGIGLLPTRHRRGNVLGSQFHLNVGGTWKKATPWINVGGTWKQATPKIRVSGAYK